jgi:ribosomal protein L19E
LVVEKDQTLKFGSFLHQGERRMATKKIGRDAGTGKFKPVKEAQRDKQGSVVETIKTPPRGPSKKK